MKEKLVKAVIDRPIGYIDKFNNVYPINYGYVPNVIGGDGEEQDVYILDEDKPLETFTGKLIAIIHRKDDIETKWVLSNKRYTKEKIWNKVKFMEKYFDSFIELI